MVTCKVKPFTPLMHCPQCDGCIDPRCVYKSPINFNNNPPSRLVEAWCDHCQAGYQASLILDPIGNFELADVKVLRGHAARHIRLQAEKQMNIRKAF